MSQNFEELVAYRIARSKETLEEAEYLAERQYWNTVANRLYYSCFYMLSALFLRKGLTAGTHNGVKSTFQREFIKPQIVSLEAGKLFNRLFNLRQEGDYIDLQRFTQEEIHPYIEEVRSFIEEIEQIQ